MDRMLPAIRSAELQGYSYPMSESDMGMYSSHPRIETFQYGSNDAWCSVASSRSCYPAFHSQALSRVKHDANLRGAALSPSRRVLPTLIRGIR